MKNVVLLTGMGVGISASGWLPSVDNETLEEEHNEDMWEQPRSVDTSLLGRVCHQLWEKVWPPLVEDPSSPAFEKGFSPFMDRIQKVVITRTSNSVGWQNSSLATRDIALEKMHGPLGPSEGAFPRPEGMRPCLRPKQSIYGQRPRRKIAICSLNRSSTT